MWVLYALLAAAVGAAVVTLTKAGLAKVDFTSALAVQSVIILVVAWAGAAIRGTIPSLATLGMVTWAFLVLAGVMTAASYLLLYRALELGDTTRVAPIDRLSLVFAVIFGAVFLKEQLTAQVIVGASFMALGALIIAVAPK